MRRIQRINELLKRELAGLILREFEFPDNALITVSRVETSNNLKQAGVYVSVMPENRTEKVLQILNKKIYDIQQTLNKRLKMRPVPKIKFIEEKKITKAGEIEKILEEIKRNQK